jgi:hypothetical protein
MGALVMDARKPAIGEELIRLADGLMYDVKKSGNNAFRTAHLDRISEIRSGASVPIETAGGFVEQPGDSEGPRRAVAV